VQTSLCYPRCLKYERTRNDQQSGCLAQTGIYIDAERMLVEYRYRGVGVLVVRFVTLGALMSGHTKTQEVNAVLPLWLKQGYIRKTILCTLASVDLLYADGGCGNKEIPDEVEDVGDIPQ
jgi:hypothetical protein